jgi:adenylate cyclase
MSFPTEMNKRIDDVLAPAWSRRKGTVVPTTRDIVMRNGAVNLDATYAYADLADSSTLGQKVDRRVAGKVIRCYLSIAAATFRRFDGEIRSFDGDRVMAIFVGSTKNADAVAAALAINWAVTEVMRPKLDAKWPSLKQTWRLKHGIGIATGPAMLVRGGVRSSNDLISVGAAPNVAAKLSSLRGRATIYVTRTVYNRMLDRNKRSQAGVNMWSTYRSVAIGGKSYTVMCCAASKRP